MRGRNRPKGPNPLTRSYESNGPDVKIRGTAQHIADKYAQLARDALAAGDPVAAENYFQHGEHYFRIVSGAQEQTRPANTGGYASRPYDDELDEGDEDGQGNGASQNGHAYNGYDDGDPSQQPQPYETRGDLNQDGRPNRDRFQNRDQRRFDNNGRQDYRRQDQPRQDYQRPDYQRPDYRQERQANRQDRQDYGRPDYRQERGDNRQEGFQENRQESRQESRPENRQDVRADQGRYDNGRGETMRAEPRQEARQETRQETRQEPRSEARPERAPRSEAARAESAPRRERRREATPVAAEDPAGLPAFLMAPARPAPAAEPPAGPEPEAAAEEAPAAKPRRRRRPRFESVAEEGEARTSAEDAATE
ncbi:MULTISPECIES: DUF4167 domain-containing protein [unclassified Methylobacterium]|jgi:hypothetical protein|uniref:DUF4167 domain-containing protein n=1 Tax=unclassified Methylobacterium TaxID=2615210 RepID=UPI0013545D29|nr:DUF4167 domain-containing protein [Methylobacterium sp. 2A]MWV24192.1 DUF4167 domain-containing protein [Methylobacterium sp. 2A]